MKDQESDYQAGYQDGVVDVVTWALVGLVWAAVGGTIVWFVAVTR